MAAASESVPRRRTRSLLRHWYTVLMAIFAAATLGCGLAGFLEQDRQADPSGRSWTLPVYKTVQLFLLNSGTEDPDNPWLACARLSAVVLVVLVSGGVIARVTRETSWFPARLLRRGHVVICGLGQIGLQLLDDCTRGGGTKVVVIEPDENNPWIYHARSVGADVVHGDATRGDVLAEAHAHRADKVFAVTGDDGANLEVVAELATLVAKRRRAPLRVYSHLLDGGLAAAMQPYVRGLPGALDIELFNVLRNSATNLITQQLWPLAPREPHEVSHFVILGFGPAGQTLAVQLAQLAHFPNRKRTRFTIADQNIVPLARQFLARFGRFTAWSSERLGVRQFTVAADAWDGPQEPLPSPLATGYAEAIEYVANARFSERPVDACDECFASQLLEEFAQPGVKPAIIICGQRDRENFDAAVRLHDRLQCLGRGDVPLLVWLPRQPALAQALAGNGAFRAFGECQTSASLEEIEHAQREYFARQIQQAYELRAVGKGQKAAPEPWNALAEHFRESNRQAADHLVIKLAAMGYRLRRRTPGETNRRLEIPDVPAELAQTLAEMEHNRWVSERLLGGWRYAPQTCRERKRHNQLVPCERLSPDVLQIDLDQIRDVLRAAQQGPYRLERLAEAPENRPHQSSPSSP